MKAIATERMPVAWASAERASHGSFVKRRDLRARGIEATGDFGDLVIEQFRQLDFQVEQPGPRLCADPQQIAETLGDQQKDPGALSLQQRVGRDGGAHLDAFDRGVAAGLQAPDPLDGGVGSSGRGPSDRSLVVRSAPLGGGRRYP
jgi:hypothetical protein